MSAGARFEGVTRRFGSTVALDNVTLEVRPGEILGLVGPDGAGKTTLFRLLVTLLRPDAGVIIVDGLDARTNARAIRRLVGYMPGRFSLYPDLTVQENLQFAARRASTTLERARGGFDDVYRQIEPFHDRLAGALSGGMKQKLALSCALVTRPSILVLDEPTTGVDAVSRREFWDLLHARRDEGLTIVVATPYMDEASRCSRVALMQGGRILATDTPVGLTRELAGTLFAVRGDRRTLTPRLRALPTAQSAYAFGEVVHYVDARVGLRPDALAAELGDVPLTHIVIEPPTVEDVFIAMSLAGRAA